LHKALKNILLGVAVGDALGVPYEFKSREQMDIEPASDMVGYGTHFQKPGTWSDDTSMTLCLAETIAEGYSLERLASKFIKWRNEAYLTAHNEVFDIGITTRHSIVRLEEMLENNEDLSTLKLQSFEDENGNGSLMRILPLLFVIKGKAIEEQFEIVWQNSALTHRHIRAAMSCMIYLNFAEHLQNGVDKLEAYANTKNEIKKLWKTIDFPFEEQIIFERIINADISKLDRTEIQSSGYVIHSLEASFWSFLNNNNYKDTVLTAVNLGDDTDTTSAIAGGLAGLYYGVGGIPLAWVEVLPRSENVF
jgi:ADP-ribosylglycohydrolase